MGKLLDRLNLQLKTGYKKDAEECLLIYNWLKETTGHVWSSEWTKLTDVSFKGYPSDERRYYVSQIGRVFLQGIKYHNIVKQFEKQKQ